MPDTGTGHPCPALIRRREVVMYALKSDQKHIASDCDKGAEGSVFMAKPMKEQPDYKAMLERAKIRFSKTLAYLAR